MFPKHLQTKGGEMLILREAETKDAVTAIQYVQQIITETDFLSRGEGEFNITEKEESALFEEYKKNPNGLFLVAEIKGKLVGLLDCKSENRPRMRHVAEFGISVSKEYWQSGIGSALIEAMIEWARAGEVIRKLSLSVRTDNQAAIQLYEKFGFQREGTLKREILIDEKFYDDDRMALYLD